MSLTVSQLVLHNLLNNPEYSSRVLPFLKTTYFDKKEESIIFETIHDYTLKYNALPTVEAIYISLSKNDKIAEKDSDLIDRAIEIIKKKTEKQSIDWLIETTEKFCQERALHNAVVEAISIIDGSSKVGKGAIPDILKEALGVTFTTQLGHDFIADAPNRFEYYHRQDIKVPFDIDALNKATKGGFSKKTCNLFLAGTHAGKTALMCHLAGANLKDGKNVLYFTLEISEEEISKRIDANIMNVSIDDVLAMSKDDYLGRIEALRSKTSGKLIVKEYPMATAGVGHFRSFINELRLKQNFVPDIIYVDYLNLCTSVRQKGNASASSYTYMKSVSEELRGFASEQNVPIVTASQLNRSGSENSDPDMTDISESFGVNFGLDFIAGILVDDTMKERNVVLIKQMKNRYDDLNRLPKFFIGFDRQKMRFYNMDDPEEGIVVPKTQEPKTFKESIKKDVQDRDFDFKF